MPAVAAIAGVVCVGPTAPHAASIPAGDVLRIATHHEPSSPAGVLAGIRFGAAEMDHTARLVGREVQVVVAAEDQDVNARIETSSAAVSIAVAGSRATAGGSPCRLHLRPTAAERRATLDGWRGATQAPAPRAQVVEWHPTLVKFGAAQLNERFTRATAAPMDADVWVGWLAVKALAEALLRNTNDDLCGTLRRQALDGHKGEPLRFDQASGRLRQPLYIATPTTVLAEVETP